MWISKIELTNFKSYPHQVFSFPEPTEGKNIILIGGMNGFGKTSVLEALYLCLYGKDAIVHLARAGLKNDDVRGYPSFLERAFNGEASQNGSESMTVKVVIHRTKTKAVEITRRWYFRSNGTWNAEEEATVRTISRGIPDAPKLDGRGGFHLSELLNEIFVPAHIAPFFFFDGEEVKKLADQGRIEQVKQGLEGLLGVVLLRSLAERLRTFESSKKSNAIAVDEGNLASLSLQLNSNAEKLKLLIQDREIREQKTSELKASRTSLIERITAAGGGGGDIATVKDLLEEREQFRHNSRDAQSKIEEIISGRLPFHLVGKEILAKFKSQLTEELRLLSWEAEKSALQPRKHQFEKSFFAQTNPAINPELSEMQRDAIKQRIETAWTSLFYPPPSGCAEELYHDYLHGPARQDALDFLDNIALGQRELRDRLSEHAEYEERVEEWNRKIARLEGIDRDGTLVALRQELDRVQAELDSISDELREFDRNITALEAQVGSQRAEYEREFKRLDDYGPIRDIVEKSERVRSVIEAVVPALFPLKVKELGSAITSVYRQLAHKDLVQKIEIKNDGQSIIWGKGGKEIKFDRSAGENQIFATALIAGLAKVSGVRAPMVVDTPLGRLDSAHRENILDFWTAESSRQVILLSQDEEIDYTFLEKINRSVAKTYLLEHTDMGGGVGRTVAKEDMYFSRGRR